MAQARHTRKMRARAPSDAGASPVLDYGFDGRTPCAIEKASESRFVCRPWHDGSGSQWFYFCIRISGLARGAGLTLDVEWPPVAAVERLPGDISEEQRRRMTQLDSFVKALPGTCGVSADMADWAPLSARPAVEGDRLTATLEGTGREMFFATQFPYTMAKHLALLDFVREREPEALVRMGDSRSGLPMTAIVLPAGEAGAVGRRVVYVQAYQHGTEFTGPLVADAMVRFLIGQPEGRAVRRRLGFHIVPAVDMDFLFYGVPLLMSSGHGAASSRGNINRDWELKTWPEVRAIDAFLRSRQSVGDRYVVGLDFHNGWGKVGSTGACCMVFPEEWAGAAYVARQKQFCDWVMARTNHEQPGRHASHKAAGLFTRYFHELTGGLVQTVEFSRHLWWNRRTQAYEPYGPGHPQDYAREALPAIAAYAQDHDV